MAKNKLAIFKGFKIRRVWDEKNEKWRFYQEVTGPENIGTI